MNFNFPDSSSMGQASMWDGLSQFCAAQQLVIKEVSNYREAGPIRATLENGATLWCEANSLNEVMVYLYMGGQEQLYQMMFAAKEWRIKNF